MRYFSVLVLATALVASLAIGQDFGINGALEIRQIAPTPMATHDLSARYVGNVGNITRYYWISTIYPVGRMQLSGPVAVTGTAALGGPNSVVLTWPTQQGATGYIVVWQLTPTFPGIGTCAGCSLTAAAPATTVTDAGVGYGIYAGGGINPATQRISVNNRDRQFPFLDMIQGNLATAYKLNVGGLDLGTNTERLDYTAWTGTPSVANIYATIGAASTATAFKAIDARVYDTGNNNGDLRGIQTLASKSGGDTTACCTGVWGLNAVVQVSGSARVNNVFGVVGDINVSGLTTVAGVANNVIAAGFFQTYVENTVTLPNVIDVAIAGFVSQDPGRRKADAAVAAVLNGAGPGDANTGAGAAFKVYDFQTSPAGDFDYGLDLYYHYAPLGFDNVYTIGDIRFAKGTVFLDASVATAGGTATVLNIYSVLPGVTGVGIVLAFPTLFADLPAAAPGAGAIFYCSDCAKATPCIGGGTGAYAKGNGASWDCD